MSRFPLIPANIGTLEFVLSKAPVPIHGHDPKFFVSLCCKVFPSKPNKTVLSGPQKPKFDANIKIYLRDLHAP